MPFPWLTRHINTNYTDSSSFETSKGQPANSFSLSLSISLSISLSLSVSFLHSSKLCWVQNFANLQWWICCELLTCGNVMIKCEGKGDFYIVKLSISLLLSDDAVFPVKHVLARVLRFSLPVPLICWAFLFSMVPRRNCLSCCDICRSFQVFFFHLCPWLTWQQVLLGGFPTLFYARLGFYTGLNYCANSFVCVLSGTWIHFWVEKACTNQYQHLKASKR